MNICIINQHTLNYGDDIAGISLIDRLLYLAEKEKKEIKINILYNSANRLNYNDRRVVHSEEVKLKKMGFFNIFLVLFFGFFGFEYQPNRYVQEFNEIIKKSDYVLVAPGGANIGIYKDWRYLVRLLMVVNLKKRLIFHNNTIGKSNNLLFNFLSRRILKKSDLYVREKKSLSLLNNMGISAIRTVDTGFLFNNVEESSIDLKDYFIFIPTSIQSWHPDFKSFRVDDVINNYVLPSFVDLAKEKSKKVVILAHLNGSLSESSLLESYRDRMIKLGMNKENVFIPTLNSCYDYDNYIKKSDYVVSMRYHGVVMAIKNKINFLSLSYENKMDEVCYYSGFFEHNLGIKQINKESIDIMKRIYNSIPDSAHWDLKLTDLTRKAAICTDQLFFREN
ncbi:polysaccharide pyruvyl transferase family protein [Enterococcus avium]|uniref:polysaccharide pyruvyl transferase family protein n=1 Tax=Enterococcus avium TaxID=33945 RepID=UPI001D0601E8|nr:polysaccharide pyruvyl transferase family protein [Enterococcus avium]MCB6918482.1 polysaccharide pyruvyl transferase family protein [Enterococcus avium]MCQ4962578.1 polysaccharide pyruvyl transferase family protein [Enterococcus avium]